MIRLVGMAVAFVFVLCVVALVVDVARTRLRPRLSMLPRPTPKPRGYDWERRADQPSHRGEVPSRPSEDREKILGFIDSRSGVEAFVEPRTMMHPLSVVLVAGDGEWARVALRDDAFLRELARTRGLTIHDAMRTGYPERMRRYRRPDSASGSFDDPGHAP
jgi:hypothetical protein